MQILDRPYEIADLEQWRCALQWSHEDAAWAIGVPWCQLIRRPNEAVPIDIEILLRLYDRDPSAPVFSSEAITTAELVRQFEPYMQPWRDVALRNAARVMIHKRYAALLGRTVSATRRWIERDAMSRVMTQVLAKLTREQDPVAVLTRVSTQTWLLRGVDLDLTCPIPSAANPPVLPRRGRPAKSIVLA